MHARTHAPAGDPLLARADRPLSVLVVALNTAPEPVGAGKYTGELTAWLAARGHRVEVVAAPPYYPDWRIKRGYRGIGYRATAEHGVRTLRCPIYVPRRPTGTRRLLHHLSFAATSLPAVLWRAAMAKPDVVLCVAPSLLSAPAALAAARLRRATAWLHVQDLELDAAAALGLLPAGAGLAARLERTLLRRFDRVSTISEAMAGRLADKGVDPVRLGVTANWVDCRAIRPLPAREVCRAAFGLPRDGFVGLYAGTLSSKQGLEVLVEAAERLRHRPDLHIAVFGDGPEKAALKARAAGLPNLTVGGLVPAERLNDLLNAADVHLLPQVAQASDLVLPSKLTGMLASGRPVVAAAPAGSGLAELVADCGLCLPANSGQAFAEALARLADDPVLCRGLARSARERAVERMDEPAVLGRLERALQGAAQSLEA